MSEWSFDELAGEVLANPNARAAAGENDIRRKLSAAFERARSEKGLSVRALASAMGTSVSQVQRLLHNEVGGTLTLRTLVRAADTLDLSLSMHARPRCDRPAKVLSFGNAAWQVSTDVGASDSRFRVPGTLLTCRNEDWAKNDDDDVVATSRGGT